MARPKTPSKVLELRGAFQKNPNRRRKDAEGSGAFNPEPPAHLPQDAVPAWHWIVVRLPKTALYSCDEVAVEITSQLLFRWWNTGELEVLRELRIWLGKLGFTPRDRTELPAGPTEEKPNAFSRIP